MWSHGNDVFFPSPYLNVKSITYKNIICEYGLYRVQNDTIVTLQEAYSKVKEVNIGKLKMYVCKNNVKKSTTNYIPKNHKIIIQYQERYSFPNNSDIVLCKDIYVDVSKQDNYNNGVVNIDFTIDVPEELVDTAETKRYIQMFLNMFQRKNNK